MIESGKFCGFDHGEEGNWKHYKQTNPPNVNLSKITAPIAIYLAKVDRKFSVQFYNLYDV